MPKTAKKTSKADQVASLRVARATRKAAKPAAPKAAPKARARATAPPRPAKDGQKAIRPGSKLEIVMELLRRPQGASSAEVCKATGWGAVSIPPIGRRAGVKLTSEKVDGVTRYRVS